MIITMNDMRSMGYCSRGVREFFENHGLDYPLFLREGIDSEVLLEVSDNDLMVLSLVEVVHGKQ